MAIGISMICSIFGHADDDRLAAAPGHRERLLHGVLQADDLERHVDAAAAGQLLHLRHGVAVARVHEIGRAELLRHVELRVEAVDRDDALGALPLRALDRVQADTTATDDGDGVALRDVGGVRGRAEAGEHAAADERRARERDVGVDLHRADLGADELLAERAERRHLMQRARRRARSAASCRAARRAPSP